MSVDDLARIVGRYTPVSKVGTDSYKANCPLPGHDDHTPSFHLFKAKSGDAMFKCFGCGAAGNPAGFLSKMDGITYAEAARMLEGNQLQPTHSDIRRAAAERRAAVEAERAIEARVQGFRDRNLDSAVPDWYLRGRPDATGPATSSRDYWDGVAGDRLGKLDADLKNHLLNEPSQRRALKL